MIRLGTIAALAVWLAGCAGDDNKLGRALVAPGGYEFYDCAQLAAQDKSLTNRSHDLEQLMARAKQGAGGGFVSAIAYDSDYASAQANLREVHRAQAEKNCPSAAPAPARRSNSTVR